MELIASKIETEGLKLFGTSHAIVKLNEELKLSFIADTHMVVPDSGLSFEEAKLKYYFNINFKTESKAKDYSRIEYKIKDDNTLELKYINPKDASNTTMTPIIDDKENDIKIYMRLCITPISDLYANTYFKAEFYFYEK